MIYFNFEFFLTLVVLITGLVTLIDILFFKKKRANAAPGKIIEYCKSFFPVLLLVLIIRSFGYELYRIPSGSLEPTLLSGDLVLVNKYDYGLYLPVLRQKFFNINSPKRGDIMVFRWPADRSYDFIKRVIGLPGDHISYINKTVYVNGKPMVQHFVADALDSDGLGHSWMVQQREENTDGVKHDIYVNPSVPVADFKDIVVPPHQYFVMGDNRDDSEDSRFWGFVPEHDIVGKAVAIVTSWNNSKFIPRWDRSFEKIN